LIYLMLSMKSRLEKQYENIANTPEQSINFPSLFT